MSYGQTKIYSAVVASGASTSSDIPLGGKPWQKVAVRVGTMSTAGAVRVMNSTDGGSTYFNVFHQVPNTTSVQAYQVFLASALGTNGGVAYLPNGGLTHLKFAVTDVVSGGVSFVVVCSD